MTQHVVLSTLVQCNFFKPVAPCIVNLNERVGGILSIGKSGFEMKVLTTLALLGEQILRFVGELNVERLRLKDAGPAPGDALVGAVLFQVAGSKWTFELVLGLLWWSHVQVDAHFGWEHPGVGNDLFARHFVLELGVQDVESLVRLLHTRPSVALLLHEEAHVLLRGAACIHVICVEQRCHDAVVRGGVDCIGDLLQIQHEGAASALRCHEPVLNDEGKTATQQVV